MHNSLVRNNHLLYFFLVVLILTTFPLAQGWIMTGDFIPRALLILVVALFNPKLIFRVDFLLLIFYYLYGFSVAKSLSISSFLANFLELAVPLIIAHYVIDEHNDKAVVVMAKFAIILTSIDMVLTIIANFNSPDIVRQMVGFANADDFESAFIYKRLGVCNYSMALISMCMAPVYIYMANDNNSKGVYILLFLLTLYFIFIAGVTTCLIICIIMTSVALLMRNKNDSRMLFPTIIIVVSFVLIFGFAIVELAEPLFRGTTFESHFEGLQSFFGKKSASVDAYDFEKRVVLYKYSLDTFLAHPLFGDVLGKNGGHNFFLDRFASYGLVGTFPLIALIFIRFRKVSSIISQKARITFSICICGFFALGFLKNMSGIDYWTYMFIYIPCILRWQTIKETTESAIR